MMFFYIVVHIRVGSAVYLNIGRGLWAERNCENAIKGYESGLWITENRPQNFSSCRWPIASVTASLSVSFPMWSVMLWPANSSPSPSPCGYWPYCLYVNTSLYEKESRLFISKGRLLYIIYVLAKDLGNGRKQYNPLGSDKSNPYLTELRGQTSHCWCWATHSA